MCRFDFLTPDSKKGLLGEIAKDLMEMYKAHKVQSFVGGYKNQISPSVGNIARETCIDIIDNFLAQNSSWTSSAVVARPTSDL